MSSASLTAGLVGKFGQSSFTSLSGLPSSGPEGGSASVIPPRPRKFFKSKNVNIVERVIVEEDIVEDNEETLLTGSNLFTPNHTIIRSSETNLVVAVRVRPMLPREKENVVDINGSQVVLAAANKIYNFDQIFGSEVCQEDIYRELVNNVVQKVLEGFNATVFAYGQTGTGKTFTMGTGNKESSMEEEGRGVVIRVLQQILGNSGQDQDFLKVNISFYEINKEQVYDLLNPSCTKVPLEVREIQKGLFKVVQLTEVEVSTVSGAVELLSKGSNLRSTESTALNSNSSRSHAVFSISLVSADQTGSTITRKLNLVDLAGSESSNRTQAVGDRWAEGVGINQGLSTLSRVITALATRKTVHIPYRDSALTKVLKESLEPHCMITMVACISPSLDDMQETVTTLRFCNQAKQLRTKPLPAHLLDSCRAFVVKKRTHAIGIPPTPQRANNTIHTVTPSKIAKSGYKKALNSTIGTPGKRARGETCLNTFTTPQMASSSRPITSTTSKDNIHLPDLSGVSVTEPPQDKTSIPTTSSTADLNSILSPLMKAVKENMQQEFDKLKSDFIKSRVETRTPLKTPIKSRATSSPNKMLASTMTSPLDMSEDTIVVTNLPSPKHEDIISGAGITFPLQGRPDPRLRAVINSASPDLSLRPSLPAYDSPPTTQTRHATNSPTIEEMERTLGINPDSPSTLMFTSSGLPPNTNKPKRSSRRKTMMASELNETFALRDIQNMDMATASRRSQRVAAQGKEVLSADTKHPLLETSNWRVVEGHNSRVLGIVNTGNTKLLAGLPGVGPKTALLIHQHRELHGSFNSLRELQMIPGVNKNFWVKFCKQNQISGLHGEN
eukprot:GFUD01045417.1.p1 GENE.GFUD01045417.1~~GFUD01045417.1.p1  ORF type:complete len:841 (+),score=290.25 GFUD01045417.1:73-2595(+)